jgi:hypothetical protein
MTGDAPRLAPVYLDHLTSADVAVLTRARSLSQSDHEVRRMLMARPQALIDLLSDDHVFKAVFDDSPDAEQLLTASPFLVFAVAVHRAVTELEHASYVPEWLGPGRWAPVFDVAEHRDFLAAAWRRFFLVELLASYTHVASGSVLVASRRGWRRQRFSELDPVRLAGLLEIASASERPGILRRLGDLCLFLTGVFPDFVGRRGFGAVEGDRIRRAGRLAQTLSPHAHSPVADAELGDRGAVGLLEALGRRSYEAAYQLVPRPVPMASEVLGALPERFGQARRILNLITERYLFHRRDQWFAMGG